jgi:hypothetical protein
MLFTSFFSFTKSPLCAASNAPNLGCPEDDVVAKQLGLAAPSNQSYCDDETVKWMNTAIRTCEKHEHGLSADSFIPERLVEVGGQNPRVVLRSDLDVGTPKYAALSYCWGSTLDAQAQLKTTKASLPERLVAINSCHLTAAVRDAVCVTKLLSLNYLWVDALCILQDSSFDWQHQCTDMAKIYGNAHVTLRAAASMSCRQGFLAQRGRRLIVPYGTNSWLGKRGSFLLQFKYVGLKGDYNFSTFKGDYNLCNLKNRGWAFQENVLSTRVLLFGHANVHFICEHMYQSRGVDYINNGPYDLRVSEQKLGEWDLYDAWDDILASYGCYTRSSFTKPEDLLPALSGLAALFNKYLQDDYLAGHWRKDLPRSLAWECPSEISKSDLFRELQASNPYLIPSWSRLCRGYTESTRVYPGLRAFQQQAQKLHAQVEREGENPFGAIKSAQLTIRSNVLDIKFLKSMELTIEPEWALHVNGQCLGDFRLDFWCESRDMLKEMQEYRLVLLGSFDNGESSGATSPREEEDLDRGACGLIVCSAVDPERFYRIGVFMPVRGKKNLGLFQRLSKVESITII